LAFEFNVASGTQDILFNVINSDANSTLNIHADFLDSAALIWGSKMLWNFENATSIALSRQFGGSLLALNANTTTSANIEGTLVAKSLVQGSEIHSQPLDPGFTAPAAVPLPAAAPLFLTALAGLGAITRRNRKTIA
ncbi:MAG: VPLPA-CTERM sorting domain-containing protein, partial [Methylococcales bacterium]|nr:VPLPA-CTERM sorting domain-containing protein [Methylococcales bacterium]